MRNTSRLSPEIRASIGSSFSGESSDFASEIVFSAMLWGGKCTIINASPPGSFRTSRAFTPPSSIGERF
jgi:hypothetical protein